MEIEKIDRAAIVEKLIKKGYVGKLITYEELKKLHSQYGNGMSESDFAQSILEVKYSNYKSCKNRGTKIAVLKSKKLYSKEEIQRRIEKIKEKGYVGKSITYEELQKLYLKYGSGMSEVDFAQKVLGISHKNFDSCKYSRKRAIILKQVKLEPEEIQRIQELLKANGQMGRKITYEEVKKLHMEYGKGISESEFAQKILMISYNNYCSCRSRGTRVRILIHEKKELPQEATKKVVEMLKEKGYIGKKITYEELQNLYKEYGKGMSESDFAQNVLDISSSNYGNFQHRKGAKVIILKSYQKDLPDEKIQMIVKLLKEKGYIGKKITYEELQNLYKEYGKGMSESDFAQNILGIASRNYESCKYGNRRAKILAMYSEKMSQQEIATIIEIIKEKGYIGKSITYQELHKLYEEYGKGMDESEFAQKILGISYANYSSGKSKSVNYIVKNGIMCDKSREILSKYINMPDFYSKEFIKRICEEYDISIEDFIIYVFAKGIGDNGYVQEAFERNGGLWIGKIPMSNKFANENIDLIQSIASRIGFRICRKYYQKSRREDYIQDAILYIIENMGGEEKNFAYDMALFEKIIYSRTQKYLRGKIISELKASNQQHAFYRKNSKSNNIFELQMKDESTDVEQQVIKQESTHEIADSSERCINLLRQYIEIGCTREEALANTAKEMNIDANEMLKYMQHYLLTQGKVKAESDGMVYWNER